MSLIRHRFGFLLVAGLPVVVLTIYALLGLHAQRRAILADAYRDGRRVAEEFGVAIEEEIREALLAEPETVLYPRPPVPGLASGDSAAIWPRFERACRQNDLATLRELCDTPAGAPDVSPAGVPVAAFAARELHLREPNDLNAQRFREVALIRAPSIMTPVFLERSSMKGWKESWRRSEERRRILERSQGEIMAAGVGGPLWDRDQSMIGWGWKPSSEGIRVLTKADLVSLIEGVLEGVSSEWMAVRVRHGGETLGVSAGSDSLGEDEVIASDHRQLATEAILRRPERLLADYYQQRRWTLAMVGLAALASGVGLSLTHAALQRERQLSDAKSQFVSSVSHELRAPVASIRLMAEALESGKISDEEKARSFHRLMAHEGARLSALVENVLDFARIEQGRKTYDLIETDVVALLNDAVGVMEPQAVAKKIALVTELEDLGFEPLVDGPAVLQALMNLIDNAVKFSPAGSTVMVGMRLGEASKSPESWRLSVTDQGIGIETGDLERIFERFVRVENELQRETQGAGIGLSLVKHVMEGHGGCVEIESVQGHGSTFTLVFPMKAADHV